MSATRQFTRHLVKAGVAHAFARTGLLDLFNRARTATLGPRIRIFGYHRVVERLCEDGPVNPALCVSVDTFHKQMEQIRERFIVLTLKDACRAITGALPLTRDACAITFDDGYRDVHRHARPILTALGLPAAVFVPTGYVGLGRALPHDRLYASFWRIRRRRDGLRASLAPESLRATIEEAAAQLNPAVQDPDDVAALVASAVDLSIARLPTEHLMQLIDYLESELAPQSDPPARLPPIDRDATVLSPDELRDLAEAGWEIGAHTIGHRVLTHESPERMASELEQPKRELEEWSEQPCEFFAYCNGYHNRAVVEAVRRAGYLGAVTTRDVPNRPGGDVFRMGRKILCEGHARGIDGRWSPMVSTAHLQDLFGTLGLTHPVDGEWQMGVA